MKFSTIVIFAVLIHVTIFPADVMAADPKNSLAGLWEANCEDSFREFVVFKLEETADEIGSLRRYFAFYEDEACEELEFIRAGNTLVPGAIQKIEASSTIDSAYNLDYETLYCHDSREFSYSLDLFQFNPATNKIRFAVSKTMMERPDGSEWFSWMKKVDTGDQTDLIEFMLSRVGADKFADRCEGY